MRELRREIKVRRERHVRRERDAKRETCEKRERGEKRETCEKRDKRCNSGKIFLASLFIELLNYVRFVSYLQL